MSVPLTIEKDNVNYTALPGGIEAWQTPDEYLPRPFDIVYMDVGRKTITGWWTGNLWMGLRLKKEDKISKWKKARDLDPVC